MKNSILMALLAIAVLSAPLRGQCTTSSSNNTFTEQDQVDAFAMAQASAGCTTLLGSLTLAGMEIGDASPLNIFTDFDAIVTIRDFGGDLSLFENATNIGTLILEGDSPELGGFENLSGVSTIGSLTLRNNPGFTDAAGLAGITIRDLIISNNANLADCSFPGTCNATGTVSITNNGANVGPGNCSDQAAFDASCQALPVELTAFTGRALRKYVELSWATATESDNAGFAVQRGTSGGDWETLHFVPALENGSTAGAYTYQDFTAPAGAQYYRLRQTDLDGTFAYSGVITVTYEGAGLSVYPNPVRDVLNVQYGAAVDAEIRVMNAGGAEVLRAPLRHGRLDVSQLPEGIYLLTVSDGSGSQTKRFVKE